MKKKLKIKDYSKLKSSHNITQKKKVLAKPNCTNRVYTMYAFSRHLHYKNHINGTGFSPWNMAISQCWSMGALSSTCTVQLTTKIENTGISISLLQY